MLGTERTDFFVCALEHTQAPVATILNDLSPAAANCKTTGAVAAAAAASNVPGAGAGAAAAGSATAVNNNLSAQPPASHHMTPKGLKDNTPDIKAMR